MFWLIRGLLLERVCCIHEWWSNTLFIQEHAWINFIVISLRDASVRSFVVRRAWLGSKGLPGGHREGFTVNRFWGSFPKHMRSPKFWSTCSSIFCRDMGDSYTTDLPPRQLCPLECVHCQWSILPQESLQSSYERCFNDGYWPCPL